MRSALRLLGGLLAALLGGAALVLLAWVLSNRGDVAPRPPAPELALVLPQPGSRLFVLTQGLQAAPGADFVAVGQVAWAALQAGQAPPPAPSTARLPPLDVPALRCLPGASCAEALAQAAPTLAEALAPQAELGRRCGALAAAQARGEVYDEGLPARLDMNTPLPSYAGLVPCSQWFRARALAAAAAGDRALAVQSLRQGVALGSTVLTGSRTLISHMIAVAMLRQQWDALAAVHRLQPGWAEALRPLVAPLPPAALDPRRWIVTEAAFVRGAFLGPDGAGPLCAAEALLQPDQPRPWPLWLGCRLGAGYLPEATRQRLEDRWLGWLRAAEGGLEPLLQSRLALRAQPEPVRVLRWRNTLGHLLLDAADPDFTQYLARLADVDLHRTALALALAAQVEGIGPAARAGWLARQPLSAGLRPRVRWQDGDAVLVARPWMAEWPGDDPRRQPVRIELPRPTN